MRKKSLASFAASEFVSLATFSAAAIIGLDQITKAYMLAHPHLHQAVGFFELYLTTNEGIAFSIPLKGTALHILILFFIVAALYSSRHHLRTDSWLSALVVGLVIGGGVGNIIDRIRFGHVLDFIKVGSWPLFNIADAAITCGIIALLIWHQQILKTKPTTRP